MEFLVDFTVNVPAGTAQSELDARKAAEAVRADELVRGGHLLRVWQPPLQPGESRILGLYSAGSERELRGLLESLPLYVWMTFTITPLAVHPNDPAIGTRA